jgi:hypothetical protein
MIGLHAIIFDLMARSIATLALLASATANYTSDAEADRVVNLPGLTEEPAFSMFSG